jgi:hypothetical protein
MVPKPTLKTSLLAFTLLARVKYTLARGVLVSTDFA